MVDLLVVDPVTERKKKKKKEKFTTRSKFSYKFVFVVVKSLIDSSFFVSSSSFILYIVYLPILPYLHTSIHSYTFRIYMHTYTYTYINIHMHIHKYV